ncbi:hypothetical protein BRADI_2g36776v3 [Brachypodium distachyon]|uniref:Uncharacterized protein n=1 Tax=Brachypodium distachyon TaxID=15368 RepID=A0A0Q3GAV2_BRADI|nr:hypothetical protein BRADI_2g36776v3 [Brachypodium distachyon]
MAGERRPLGMIIGHVDRWDYTRSVVLARIHGHYKEALARLPAGLTPSLLDAGFGFGFLDPVSNIIANTVSQYHDRRKRERDRSGIRMKKRSRAFATPPTRFLFLGRRINNLRVAPPPTSSAAAAMIRSKRKAQRRRKAAISKIVQEHSSSILPSVAWRSFCGLVTFLISYFRYLTIQDALFYLCLSNADLLVAVRIIDSDRACPMLAIQNTRTKIALGCAAISVVHPRATTFVSRSFSLASELDKAISRMPKHDLCSRHHRGLLKAGHCFGPFDPVNNIILNTICSGFEVQLVCTKSLARIERLSLYGLVAFTRIVFPSFSEYEATVYLLTNIAQLDRFAIVAQQKAFSESVAYGAAARTAFHPCPAALVEFVTTLRPDVRKTLRSMLGRKWMLSSTDVCTISQTLSHKCPLSNSLPKSSTDTLEIISAKCGEFDYRQSVIVKRVEAALHRYGLEGEQEYELHVICDVNDDIPDDSNCNYMMDTTRFSHINVWARRKASQYADPTLFFIECSNNIEDMKDMKSSCFPVLMPSSEDSGRCFHCEYEGTRIIHPASEIYLGRRTDFEDMARKKHPMCNEELVMHGDNQTFFEEIYDSIYFGPA